MSQQKNGRRVAIDQGVDVLHIDTLGILSDTST
jgi:hypothetical protein